MLCLISSVRYRGYDIKMVGFVSFIPIYWNVDTSYRLKMTIRIHRYLEVPWYHYFLLRNALEVQNGNFFKSYESISIHLLMRVFYRPYELLALEYNGNLKSYFVSPSQGFKPYHTFCFCDTLLSSATYVSLFNILIVAFPVTNLTQKVYF